MDDLLVQMGSRIIARRKQLRLTQEELSERAGLTSQTISYAELGKKGLRPGSIVSICKALQISPTFLLQGEIATSDISILSEKVSQLTPEQYRYLEDIIDSYVAAVKSGNSEA